MDDGSTNAPTIQPPMGVPRRQVLRGMGGLAAAAWYGHGASVAVAIQAGSSIAIPCVPCACEGDVCACCLVGFTGGGVVQLSAGEAQIVVFATRLEEGASQQGAGFVRWIDTDWNGQNLMLESVGPIVYERVPGEDQTRDIRGIMRANGQGEHSFHLRVTDFGPSRIGQDLAALSVGQTTRPATPASASSTPGVFRYEQHGRLVGGDFQLLDSVAPVQPK